MTRRLLFAANWKMHLGPDEARDFARRFRARYAPDSQREVWFFPSDVSLEATAVALGGLEQVQVGVQNVHWELKGAFTGATSAPLARAAGATAALVGHSERRHVFGESDEETGRKVRAVLAAGLVPVLCVGETLEQRERGETASVVTSQLAAGLRGVGTADLDRIVIAYEPVWAIGTGRNATPADAGQIHACIRKKLFGLGARTMRILYGGSVNRGNVAALLAEPELDGVLVGGASLDPEGWAEIVSVTA
jgi:triosephosphate isomerase (TIM)